jgi:RNA polymerase sigma-70 factor, ECF subfamily
VSTDLRVPGVECLPAVGPTAGKPPTFEQIFRDEAVFVGRTLRYLGVSESNLEDACQEVFVVVYRRLSMLQGGSVRAWVRQICMRVASNFRRSHRRRPEDAVAEPPDVAVAATQHGDAEGHQARRRLLGALDTLSEEQRNVFVLYEVEQLTMPEIVEAIGCPLQTAYSRLHAARAKVQAAMKGVES